MATATELRTTIERAVQKRIEDLESRYRGWHVWCNDAGRPMASKAGCTLYGGSPFPLGRPADPGEWWTDLERQLAEASTEGPTWNIFDPAECDAI